MNLTNTIKNKLNALKLIIFSRLTGVLSILLRTFIKVDNNSILLWSWDFRQYGCNPKAISDYLSTFHPEEFIIYWSFKDKFPINLDKNIIPLKWGSWNYLVHALKCKFLISNTRNNIETMLFYKRKQQIYVMTWHAGMGLKKAEKDVEQALDERYIKRSKYDSKICNLMISGSKFQTNLIKKSFWYNREILNCGTPRNDVFFKDTGKIRADVCVSLNIQTSSIIVLYAPTFRRIFNPDVFNFNWERIKNAIEKRFNKKAVLLIRLHPNIRNKISHLKFKFNNSDCINVSDYPDMQQLLIASDILITDYSSSMFDFTLTKRPCFLFVRDGNLFDRGFYLPLSKLPFDLSENEEELEQQISHFDETMYLTKLDNFNKKIGSFEKGNASECIYNWLCKKREE